MHFWRVALPLRSLAAPHGYATPADAQDAQADVVRRELLARLTIRVLPHKAPGLRVRAGQGEVPAALIGVPSPMSPGRVEVQVEAAGFRGAVRESALVAGQETTMDINLFPAGPPATGPTARETLRPEAGVTSGPGPMPWVVMGVGVAEIAAGSAQSDRDAACGAAGCLNVANDYDASYRGLLVGSTIAFIAGGAAVAGGLLWRLLAPVGTGSARASIAPLPGGVALGIGGAF